MQLTGISEDKIAEVLSGVIFYDPKQDPGSRTGKYLAADEYLSGNVREKLKEAETRTFMDYAFRDGNLKTTGTDLDKILPPVSRFGGGREKKKATVIEKLSAFFERFFGIS